MLFFQVDTSKIATMAVILETLFRTQTSGRLCVYLTGMIMTSTAQQTKIDPKPQMNVILKIRVLITGPIFR